MTTHHLDSDTSLEELGLRLLHRHPTPAYQRRLAVCWCNDNYPLSYCNMRPTDKRQWTDRHGRFLHCCSGHPGSIEGGLRSRPQADRSWPHSSWPSGVSPRCLQCRWWRSSPFSRWPLSHRRRYHQPNGHRHYYDSVRQIPVFLSCPDWCLRHLRGSSSRSGSGRLWAHR